MAWLGIWFGISNTSGNVYSNWEGQNRETDEEHYQKGFQLDRLKLDRDGEISKEALSMGNGSINIWDGSELESV